MRSNTRRLARAARKQAVNASARPCLHVDPLESRVLFSSYFVSTGGADTNPGTEAAPFRTLLQAVTIIAPGDEIVLRSGTYAGGVQVRQPNVTIRSYEGERASIVAPTNDPAIENCIKFRRVPDGKLINLDISGGYYYGVMADGSWGFSTSDAHFASRLLIQGCRISNTGRDNIKITPGCNDVVIRNNELFNSGVRDSSNAEGIDNVNGDRMIVQDNYIHDIATNGVYAKGGAANCVIEGNRIERTGSLGITLGFYTDGEFFDADNTEYYESIDSVVRNNVISATQYAGIGVYAALRPLVYNNTIVDVARAGHGGITFVPGTVWLSDTHTAYAPTRDPQVYNNIIVMGATNTRPAMHVRVVDGFGGLAGTPRFDNNIYYRAGGGAVTFRDERTGFTGDLAGWRTAVGADAASRVVDPTLDANNSYHLVAGSPAIDTGRDLGAAFADDIDGQSRPGGAGWDVGADEFNSGAPAAGVLQFSVASYTVGESGGTATITVTRTGSTAGAASVNYATSNGTAAAGSDYTAASGTLTFADGEASKTFVVTILGDGAFEGAESLNLSLSNPVGATLGTRTSATLGITDDDAAPLPPPTVQFSAAGYTGAEGGGVVTITVTRSGDTASSSTVNYATSNGTATSGSDYTAASGTLTFAAGQTSRTFTITVLDDAAVEAAETILLTLTSPGGATLGSRTSATVTLSDNDTVTPPPPPPPPPGTFNFGAATYAAGEGGGTVTVTVTRSGDASGAAAVNYATADGSATAADYTGAAGTLSFAAGETSKTFSVQLVDDAADEADESFTLTLSNAVGATLGATTGATVTIGDNDEATLPPPPPPPAPNSASISGRFFNDANGNGLIDGGEAGLGGWKVYLDLDGDGVKDRNEPSKSTDTAGNYAFTGLPGGIHRVVAAPKSRMICTTASQALAVSVADGQAAADAHFGFAKAGSVRGTVYADLDANNVRTRGEKGVAKTRVFLDDNDNGVLDAGERSTVTNAKGGYAFTRTKPGQKNVKLADGAGTVTTATLVVAGRTIVGVRAA